LRRPTAKGCAGALVAIAVLAIAVVAPSRLGEPPVVPRVESFISSACGGDGSPCPTAERLAWLGRLEAMLAERMPGLPESDRTRLADVIYGEAHEAALDPLFVLAMIGVESGFDHVAESERGARGLMQLRPETLEAEAARSQLKTDDLDDPILNVQAGVRYYRRLLRAFGSPDVALMAYNAGPNRILRYLEEDGTIPERFQIYPQRVQGELRKLRRRQPQLAMADVRSRPAAPARAAR
jgi:Transglycosylase SLT domain